MIFQGLSVARSCPAPITILDIKRRLLSNSAKHFKSRQFIGQSSTGFKCSITIEF